MNKKYLHILLLFLWLGFIYYNSAQPATISEGDSVKVFNILKGSKDYIKSAVTDTSINDGKQQTNAQAISNTTKPTSNMGYIDHIIRKNAHAFEFLVLAILVANVLKIFGLTGKNALVYIMFICLLCAVLDEYHQLFVPGRASQVTDVLIDFAGSLWGLTPFILLKRNKKL